MTRIMGYHKAGRYTVCIVRSMDDGKPSGISCHGKNRVAALGENPCRPFRDGRCDADDEHPFHFTSTTRRQYPEEKRGSIHFENRRHSG